MHKNPFKQFQIAAKFLEIAFHWVVFTMRKDMQTFDTVCLLCSLAIGLTSIQKHAM